MKTYVSFDFKSTLGEAALAQFAVNVLTRMKGNAKFSTLQPLIDPGLQTTTSRYALSLQEAADGSRTRIAEKRARRQELLDVLERLAIQLGVLADGNEALILESGFNPRRRGQKVDGPPEQVQDLRVSQGLQSGEVILEYKTVSHARMYGVEWSLDQGEHWHNGIYPSGRRAVVNGLPSRQDILFRVFALGTQQRKGAPSLPVRAFVL